jgi:thymidylate kinase
VNQELAPVIALIGADGAGKSKLIGDLLPHVRQTRPAEAGYLGLGSGPLGRKINALPVIGPPLARFLKARARQARDPKGKIPDFLTALILYRYSLKRKARFDKICALRRAGITVLADRYPQIEIAGFYDGPGLSAAPARNPVIARLAARERQLYEDMAQMRPTLILRLNIDLTTALQRAGDHEIELLAQKVAATPTLTFNGAPIVEIDARRPYEQVLVEAKRAIDAVLRQ